MNLGLHLEKNYQRYLSYHTLRLDVERYPSHDKIFFVQIMCEGI